MIKRNQLGVLFNAYQGKYKKVLTVCSAGAIAVLAILITICKELIK